jgi:hypothetical protein
MENLKKQRLLETTDTLERMEDLLPILQEQTMEANAPAYYRISSRELSEWVSSN